MLMEEYFISLCHISCSDTISASSLLYLIFTMITVISEMTYIGDIHDMSGGISDDIFDSIL
jgi:hypothetical protein